MRYISLPKETFYCKTGLFIPSPQSIPTSRTVPAPQLAFNMPQNVAHAIKRPCAPLSRGGSVLDSFILTPACPASVPAMSVKACCDSANEFSAFDEEAGCEVSAGLQGGFHTCVCCCWVMVGWCTVGLLSARRLLLVKTSRSMTHACLPYHSLTGCVATMCAAVTRAPTLLLWASSKQSHPCPVADCCHHRCTLQPRTARSSQA